MRIRKSFSNVSQRTMFLLVFCNYLISLGIMRHGTTYISGTLINNVFNIKREKKRNYCIKLDIKAFCVYVFVVEALVRISEALILII